MGEVFVARWQELADDGRLLITWGPTEVAVMRRDGEIFAYENRCSHQGGPVGEGVILPRVECVLDSKRRNTGERFSDAELHLVCPWHGWEYELRTGRSVTHSDLRLRKYEVRLSGDDIYVDLPDAG